MFFSFSCLHVFCFFSLILSYVSLSFVLSVIVMMFFLPELVDSSFPWHISIRFKLEPKKLKAIPADTPFAKVGSLKDVVGELRELEVVWIFWYPGLSEFVDLIDLISASGY